MSLFVNINEDRVIYRGSHFFMIYDAYPVSQNHLLIISNELREDYFVLTDNEQQELPEMINKAKSIIEREITPDGYNIGMNCGASAGQTVMHFHCHIIPRFDGDVDNPRGGVRHCVMHKGYY
ncbi:HIT family protein [Winogradskyella sp.]|nr:HIT family protein [Winogradskyella sp.]